MQNDPPNKVIKNSTTKTRCAGLASSPFMAALYEYVENGV
ncbi:MAG: hypothetical protein ACJAS1_007513 [Oleiphilaceae bacterium]|jgi:hypothetical protein